MIDSSLTLLTSPARLLAATQYVRFAEPRDGQHGRLGLGTKGRHIKVTVNASKLTHADWFQLQIQQYGMPCPVARNPRLAGCR